MRSIVARCGVPAARVHRAKSDRATEPSRGRVISAEKTSAGMVSSARFSVTIILLLCASLAHAGSVFELRMIKYNDLDQDGTNNEINTSPGDPVSGNALTGWQFTVYDDTGAVVAQNTTSVENPGANGDLGIRAGLPGLDSGQEYTICETQQAGWINTDPGTIDPGFGQPCETITLTSSTTVTRYFGNYQENIAPTADAGPDQTLSDGDDSGSELVVLDGSGSSDTDGTIADSDYVWTVGPTEIAVGENPSFSFAVGTTDVTLTVTDDDGATDTDTVQITVEPPDTYELRMIKYNDLDQDGTNNEINTGPGDPTSGNALTGWQFTVYDDTGALVAQNTTSVENPGANGDLGIRAGLPGLISGQEYTICETQQVGWINTDPATVDPAFGQPCETVTLTSSTNATRYFGNKLVDDPPVAVCPMDQSVVDADNDGSELVDLLDNGSSDDNGIVGYRWLNGLGIQIATGEIASFSFAVGTTVVTLEVRDAADQTDSCEFEVTVTEPDLFTVGGTVTWLQGSGLRIRNNGGDELTVDENGSFSFPTPLLDGSGYNVTIASQPTGPVQTCGVVNPSGMIGGADVDDIAIACATDLAIRKSDGSATVNAGGPVTWVIEVSNNGPLPVQGALVRDLLPPAREPFASWVCVASPGAACTPSGAGSIMEFVDLEVGSSVVFALTVEIPDDFGGVLVNEASVMPPPEMDDLNPANNVAQDQSLAVLFADGFEAPLELLLRALRMNEQN